VWAGACSRRPLTGVPASQAPHRTAPNHTPTHTHTPRSHLPSEPSTQPARGTLSFFIVVRLFCLTLSLNCSSSTSDDTHQNKKKGFTLCVFVLPFLSKNVRPLPVAFVMLELGMFLTARTVVPYVLGENRWTFVYA